MAGTDLKLPMVNSIVITPPANVTRMPTTPSVDDHDVDHDVVHEQQYAD